MRADTGTVVERPARAAFVDTGGRQVFLWHHSPARQRRRAAAIVLCPAIGYEYMSSYRTWRRLADRLAVSGFDVVRFDYDGTGNSAGAPEEPRRVEAWLGSIAAAIAEARRLAQSDRIALVGLRAGSLLALHAAMASTIERLVLWSPFATGRACVRELKAIARLNELSDETEGPGINAEGHLITDETVQALLGLTLEGITRRPAPHVLLLERDDRRPDAAVDGHLRALGSRVDRHSIAGTAEMLLPPHLAKVPEHALDTIANWFNPWHEAPAGLAPAVADETSESVACGPGYAERPVQFGPEQRLFGIFTQPADGRRDMPSIVCLSTGAGHHVGPHRLYVPLARSWAAQGHVVLRFDLGGIGDSMAPRGAGGGDAYPDHMIDDAREALAFVRKQAPERPVILLGLCSGGWLAFEAARSGLAVDAIASINPPLYLRDGRQWVQQQRQLDRYQRSIRDPVKWLKALRSGSAAAAAAHAIVRRAGRSAAARLRHAIGDPLPRGLSSDLQAIASRNITALFVFSEGDNGHRYFEQHATPALGRSDVGRFIQHVVVKDAGHAFRPFASQRMLTSMLKQFVARVSTPTEPASVQKATWTRRPV